MSARSVVPRSQRMSPAAAGFLIMSLLESHGRMRHQDFQSYGEMTYAQFRGGLDFIRKTVAPRFGDRILVCDQTTNEYFFATDPFEVRLYLEHRVRDMLSHAHNLRVSFEEPLLLLAPGLHEGVLYRSHRHVWRMEKDLETALGAISRQVEEVAS